MYSRFRLNFTLLALAFCCAAGDSTAHAADVLWVTSPGTSDTEVATDGVQLFGYYFSSNPTLTPTVNVNSVPFDLRSSPVAPPGLSFNGSYDNPEGEDLYQVPASPSNQGLQQILDSQNW